MPEVERARRRVRRPSAAGSAARRLCATSRAVSAVIRPIRSGSDPSSRVRRADSRVRPGSAQHSSSGRPASRFPGADSDVRPVIPRICDAP